MSLSLQKIINRISSTSKRPNNSIDQIGNNHRKWGNYISFNTVNTLIFLLDLFIQRLEKSGVKPNKRLLSITELNLIELEGLKQVIMLQIMDCKITLYQKDCFIQFTNQQRQDFNCLFTDYELLLSKTCKESPKEIQKIGSEFDMITNLRTEMNKMLEIRA